MRGRISEASRRAPSDARRPPPAAADVRETHELVLKHVHSARKIRDLSGATIVFVLESNLA